MNNSREIETFISRVRDLPTLPSVVLKVNQALMDNSATIDSVSDIVEKDPSLTSKVLRLANSSYYGFSYHVDTLARAITVLGFNTIRSLATTVSVFRIFGKEMIDSFDMKGLWHHSLGCAIASKALVSMMETAIQEKAFVCGLIHDIGKVVIAQNLPGETAEVLRRLEESNAPDMAEMEKELMGFTHPEVGALIAERWHFPKEFSEAIRLHHCFVAPGSGGEPPGAAGMEKKEDATLLTCAVYAGNQVPKKLGLGNSQNKRAKEIQPAVWEILDLTGEELPELFAGIKEDFSSIVNSWSLE